MFFMFVNSIIKLLLSYELYWEFYNGYILSFLFGLTIALINKHLT